MKNTRTSCLICGSQKLTKTIDLGFHPFADTFLSTADLGDFEYIQRLACDFCTKCYHTQLRYVTNPSSRYMDVDYSYTSSNSQYAMNYWTEYALQVPRNISLPEGSKVIEVGSNDGFLLSLLKKKYQVVGVDASMFVAKLARERGIETITALFDTNIAQVICDKNGEQDLVIANNVLNHADDPSDFVKGVSNVLRDGGWFVFEFPYWLKSIVDRKFDQIYHEHVSYFTVNSIDHILSLYDLAVRDIQETHYHGGSIRIYAQKKAKKEIGLIQNQVSNERSYGMHDLAAYYEFYNDITLNKHRFMETAHRCIRDGYKLVCAGAGAKTNTFLNFFGLNDLMVTFVTDTSPYKIGKFTPMSRLEIVHDEKLAKVKRTKVITTSWNLESILRPKLRDLNPNIEFFDAYKQSK